MRFPLNVILSVTTGRLLCDIGRVYEILNHITNDNLFTHQLPRACRFAKPLIESQYPELSCQNALKELDNLKVVNSDVLCAINKWLDWLIIVQKFKSAYDIASHADAWLRFDPVKELELMVGKERVIQVWTP